MFNVSFIQCAPVVSMLQINGQVFYAGDSAIEIVPKWPHLCRIIANNCDDEFDITSRKFNLIGLFNNIICNLRMLIVSQSLNYSQGLLYLFVWM